MKQNALIFGACSAIAQATCKNFKDTSFLLIARENKKLLSVANDLEVRGNKCQILEADLSNPNQELFDSIKNLMPEIDLIFIAHGFLPNQEKCITNIDEELKNFDINLLSPIKILNHYANYFVDKSSGTIAVITSVAGDRGRQSNYSYGSAKGALSIYLQGLRNRVSKNNVTVLDIKPGFISTPMTEHLKQGPLFSTADAAGRIIKSAIDKKKDIAYIPNFWMIIMLIIKLIPERIFKKLKI